MAKTRAENAMQLRSHRDLLHAIARLHRQGKPALVRTLMFDLKRPFTSIHAQLDRLCEEGYIEDAGEPNETRVAVLTEKGRRAARQLGAPVGGFVPAGLVRVVPEMDGRDAEGEQIYLESWDDLLPPTEDYLVLIVRGDSMIGDAIQEGDEVHLRRGGNVRNMRPGQIAAVLVGADYEATLKHVFYEAATDMVTLRASNPAYPDIVEPAMDVRVVGTFRGLVRLDADEVNTK